MKKLIDRAKRNKTLSEVKPVKNKNFSRDKPYGKGNSSLT